ncbi:MAG TPA: hypothetical protein VFU94_10645 [Conexibacter sp.]|nr:hypothetical protein [Conexibacter sp.]
MSASATVRTPGDPVPDILSTREAGAVLLRLELVSEINNTVLELAGISLPAGLVPLTRAAIVFGALMLYLAENRAR